MKKIYKNRVSYLFLLPYFSVFVVFTIVPVIMSIGFSFTYYNILQPPKWVGWRNYTNLFLADDVFLIAIKNTFIFAVICGPLSFIASVLFGWLINELRPKVRAIFVLAFYAPAVSGQAYTIWAVLFSGDTYGYLNGILMNIGAIYEPIQWLKDPKYILYALITVTVWMSLGAGFLAIVAGLQGVDRSLYEAGCVDGIRNRWQELWFITLPYMKPQMMFLAVMCINQSFAVYDVSVALAGFPSTDYAGSTVVTHLVDYGFVRFEMGYASAVATILFVVMIFSNRFVQSLLKKVGR